MNTIEKIDQEKFGASKDEELDQKVSSNIIKLQMYFTDSTWDVIRIILAILCSLIAGVSMPVLAYLFGQSINYMGESGGLNFN